MIPTIFAFALQASALRMYQACEANRGREVVPNFYLHVPSRKLGIKPSGMTS